MQKFKRILAAGLTLAMLLSVMPVGAFAEEVPEAVETTAPEITEAIEETTAPVETTEPAVETTAPVETTEPFVETTAPVETTEPTVETTAPVETTEPTAETTAPTEEEPEFTLTFDPNGGVGAPEAAIGETVTIGDEIPVREGYFFLGWTTSAQGGEDFYGPGDELTLTADLTLYAQWREGEDMAVPMLSGTCGDNLTWTFVDGTLTISGNGKMTDFAFSSTVPWYSLRANITAVVIQFGVTSISAEAFYNFDSLTSVTIPGSVTNIGDYAFHSCDSLANVSYSGTNDQRNSLVIGHKNLWFLYLLDGFVSGSCGANVDWNFANGTLTINGIGPMNNYYPHSSSSNFERAPWYSICDAIETVIIEGEVTSIGSNAFYRCGNITKVMIPASVINVSTSSFSGCSDDLRIYYGGTPAQWNASACALSPTYADCGDKLTWQLKDNVLSIGGSGTMWSLGTSKSYPWYDSRSAIQTVVIESDVTSIGNNAFWGCDNLMSVTLSGYMTEIGSSAFWGCSNLKSVTISENGNPTSTAPSSSATGIGGSAFSGCSSLVDVEIPYGITSIGRNAFGKCSRLTEVIIPETVITVDTDAFDSCNDLSQVTFKGTKSQWDAIAIGNRNNPLLFARLICTDYEEPEYDQRFECGTSVKAFYKDGVLTIAGKGSMHNWQYSSSWPWYSFCRDITKVVVMPGVTKIGNYAFCDCSNLRDVTISTSVTAIGYNAFYGCTQLKTAELYGENAQWSAISIGSNNEPLTSAQGKCFSKKYDCGNNLMAYYNNGMLTITGSGELDFSGGDIPWADISSQITVVVIEDGVTSIGDETFANHSYLSDLVIPSSVISIGNNAFSGCGALQNIQYWGTQEQWKRIKIGQANLALKDLPISYQFIPQVELVQDYICLTVGESATLDISNIDSFLHNTIQWSVESTQTRAPVTVDSSGVVTAETTGTAFVVALVTVDGTALTSRCRVDVTVKNDVQSVSLGTDSVDSELFSRNYAEFDVLFRLASNTHRISSMSQSTNADPASHGIAIERAQFADKMVANLFKLIPTDDRTLQIVPTETALKENGNAVTAKSYYTEVIVTVNGRDYTTDCITLTVKKTLPKTLKAQAMNFNGFFSGQTLPAQITGATVTGLQLDPAKTPSAPSWLTIQGTDLALKEYAPAKGSATVYALAETEEWAVPVPVTIPVKLTTTAPKLKLAPASAVFPAGNGYKNCEGLPMQLVSSDKKVSLESLGISKISAPWGFEIQDLDPVTGNFLLVPTRSVTAGSRSLYVYFTQSSNIVNLTLKVNAQAVKPKLSATSLKLNKAINDVGAVTLTSQIPGYAFDEPTCTILRNKVSVPGELDINWEDGKLLVGTNKKTVYGGSYQIQIQVEESIKPLTLKVTVPAKAKSALTAKLTVKGKLDVTRDSSSVVVTPKFTNYNGITDLGVTLAVQYSSNSGGTWRNAAEFTVASNEDGTYTISKVPGAAPNLSYKYRAVMTANGSQIGTANLALTSGSAKFTANVGALYKADRYSRADLQLSTTDDSLNVINRVTFKDYKQTWIYQIYSYGNGEFAIGFRNNQVSTAAKTGKITLNLFAEGNTSAKPNATVTVNLQVR